MSYIEQSLAPQEQILHRASVSTAFVFFQLTTLLIVAVVGGVLCAHIPPLVLFALPVLLFWFLPALLDILVSKATTEVALTNVRIVLKWGLIRRNTIETYVDKVEGIELDQGIMGRLFNYGGVQVRGTGGRGTPCPGIANPQDLRRAVNELLLERRPRTWEGTSHR